MSFSDEIAGFQSSAKEQLHALNTQEKTQNALLFPFLEILGYEVFDVREVEPGFTIDTEDGNAEQADYAIKRDGAPVMLFHCEEAGTGLGSCDPDSLHRPLRASDAQVGVLTNGIVYRFFVDLGEGNTVDKQPFLEFNLLNHGSDEVQELERMKKSSLDPEDLVSTVRNRKYERLLYDYLQQQWSTPGEEFVRFLAEKIHDGQPTEDVLGRIQPIVRTAIQRYGQEAVEGPPTRARQAEDGSSAEAQRDGHDEEGSDEHPTKKILENF
ncbi:MAG: hypothetical protein ABEL04_11940 [Salinibacter sp.]|uniref:hypothetical protein n=1 Tax=Salinibacter sp. TaxID=2065818 RepID=UPI0035D4D04D